MAGLDLHGRGKPIEHVATEGEEPSQRGDEISYQRLPRRAGFEMAGGWQGCARLRPQRGAKRIGGVGVLRAHLPARPPASGSMTYA